MKAIYVNNQLQADIKLHMGLYEPYHKTIISSYLFLKHLPTMSLDIIERIGNNVILCNHMQVQNLNKNWIMGVVYRINF